VGSQKKEVRVACIETFRTDKERGRTEGGVTGTFSAAPVCRGRKVKLLGRKQKGGIRGRGREISKQPEIQEKGKNQVAGNPNFDSK